MDGSRIHTPSTQPTAGDWHCPQGASTVWTANGDTQIAACNSRHLCHAGNVANARFIAGAPSRAAAARALILAADAVIDAKAGTPEEVSALARLIQATDAAKAVHP